MLLIFGIGVGLKSNLFCKFGGNPKSTFGSLKSSNLFSNMSKSSNKLLLLDILDCFKLVNDNVLGFYLERFVKRRLFVLKKGRSWRGVRHEQRLPVRGQRTKTNASTRKRQIS